MPPSFVDEELCGLVPWKVDSPGTRHGKVTYGNMIPPSAQSSMIARVLHLSCGLDQLVCKMMERHNRLTVILCTVRAALSVQSTVICPEECILAGHLVGHSVQEY